MSENKNKVDYFIARILVCVVQIWNKTNIYIEWISKTWITGLDVLQVSLEINYEVIALNVKRFVKVF